MVINHVSKGVLPAMKLPEGILENNLYSSLLAFRVIAKMMLDRATTPPGSEYAVERINSRNLRALAKTDAKNHNFAEASNKLARSLDIRVKHQMITNPESDWTSAIKFATADSFTKEELIAIFAENNLVHLEEAFRYPTPAARAARDSAPQP